MTPLEDAQIRDAICGHAEWLRRFDLGIKTGHLPRPAADISCDDQCAFGQWLKTLPADSPDPTMVKYRSVAGQHRRFHAAAGQIARKVERGQREEAQADFASTAFKRLTSSLILTLHDWRQDFKTPRPLG